MPCLWWWAKHTGEESRQCDANPCPCDLMLHSDAIKLPHCYPIKGVPNCHFLRSLASSSPARSAKRVSLCLGQWHRKKESLGDTWLLGWGWSGWDTKGSHWLEAQSLECERRGPAISSVWEGFVENCVTTLFLSEFSCAILGPLMRCKDSITDPKSKRWKLIQICPTSVGISLRLRLIQLLVMWIWNPWVLSGQAGERREASCGRVGEEGKSAGKWQFPQDNS